MEDGAEVLAKAQYQLTLSYEEFLLLTAAKDSYDKHLEKIQKKLQNSKVIIRNRGDIPG
jgi:thymidylate kinase